MAGERVEQDVDILRDVVEVKRDAKLVLAGRDDDPLGGERRHERVDVGRADADERATAPRIARRDDGCAEGIEPVEEPLDQAGDVRLDRGTPASSTSDTPATPA